MDEAVTDSIEHLGEDYVFDPHSHYKRFREKSEACPITLVGHEAWMVTRYADVRAALADPRLSKDMNKFKAGQAGVGFQEWDADRSPGQRMLSGHLLNMDPPDHQRLRKLVSKVFTVRRIEALRPRVEQITDRLLTGLAGHDVIDLLPTFAFPLPMTVISELLGVPENDRAKFSDWANAITVADSHEVLRQAGDEMASYLVGLIADKRVSPDDALISALVQVRDSEDRLSEDELISMVFQLLVAGYETTAHLIGNGLITLLRHPDQFAALRADRSLLPGAVEEFLRYENSLHVASPRYTTEPVELGSVVIPEGEIVTLAIGSGNRDSRHYADAESFDITRDATGHLGFGHGIHHCLGAPLARLEVQVAFAGLLDRFDRIELAVPLEELRWQMNITRGLEKLPVRLA